MTSPAVTPSFTSRVAYFATSFTTLEFAATPTHNPIVDYFHLDFFTPTPEVEVVEVPGRPGATPGVLGTWTWQVRDAALNRVAEINEYTYAEFVARYNDVGTWTVTLPSDAVAASALSTPGSGVVVVHDGIVVFSGPTNEIHQESRSDAKTLTISGYSDEVWLQRRVAVPNPDDGQLIGGAIPYPPTADVVKTGVTGIPDTVNLYNDLDNDAFADTIGVVSVAGQTMLYRATGTITPGFLNPYRITGVRVTATGRADQGVDNAMLAYIRVGGTNYFGLGWVSLSGSPQDAKGTWLTNPATGLPWTVAQIETLINSGGFGFTMVSPSANVHDTGVGRLVLEVLSFAQDEYDNRANTTSTVMLRYADLNAGPSALPPRRVYGLTMAVDPVIGGTHSTQARYTNLLELEQNIATPHNLGFRVGQVGAGLDFEVYQPLDRTTTVRFAPKLETMDDSSYGITAPAANTLYLGVNGEGVERTVAEPQDPQSVAQWQRIEAFVDRRDIKTYTDIPDASSQALAETAAATALEFTPVDQVQMRYRQDWQLGDQVTVDIDVISTALPAGTISRNPVIPSSHLSVTVVEVGFKFDAQNVVTMSAKVGSPSPRAILAAFDRARAQQRAVASRLRALETKR